MTGFEEEVSRRVTSAATNHELHAATVQFMRTSIASKYSYNFTWLGRPIIQYPQDVVAMQELIWRVRPDLVIETGIAHGGSLVLSASMLALLDLCDAIESGAILDPVKSNRKVLAVDIDIRTHNRMAIESHPMFSRIQMIEGSSIDKKVIEQVRAVARNYKRILVCLDSNHTHAHVLAELKAYAPMVTPGSYCVVFDTIVEDLPKELSFDRPWGPGNNPKTAVREFMSTYGSEFTVDRYLEDKLQISVAPGGFLKREGGF